MEEEDEGRVKIKAEETEGEAGKEDRPRKKRLMDETLGEDFGESGEMMGEVIDIRDSVPEPKKQKKAKTDEPPEGILEDEINITDSQVMIQLKESEEEAEKLRREIDELRAELDIYMCKNELTEEDEAQIKDIQDLLMEKLALLDALTKKIARLMELAGRTGSEDATILDEDEEEGFPDDLLPRVVICSSWDDMMPKVVVCMDMKKPSPTKKKAEDNRDENGLTPEQREALEQERRCMAEERNRLQYQLACMEGEMRVMMRENDMLSRKVAQLKAEIENQPPFEFEMSVSATNPPGCGAPKPGNMDIGYGVMGPAAGGQYRMGAALSPGAEVQGKLAVQGPPVAFPPGFAPPQQGCCSQDPCATAPMQGGLPCGGMNGVPGKSVACPRLQPLDQQQQQQQQQGPNDWTSLLPPYGKKCRKDFNASQTATQVGGGCTHCAGASMGCQSCPMSGAGCNQPQMQQGMTCCPQMSPETLLMKRPPMDVNFKVNVQPQAGSCNKRVSMDAESKSNKISHQLQEIEMELKRMQRDLCKAKKDKETLKAQQDTLNCTKHYLT